MSNKPPPGFVIGPGLLRRIARLRRIGVVQRIIGQGSTAERLNRKRFVRGLLRKWQKRWRRAPSLHERLRGLPPIVLASRYRPNLVADALLEDRSTRWVPIRQRVRTPSAITLKTFSFIDDPHATLEALRAVVVCEGERLVVHVNFSDEELLDLAPYLGLAEIWNGLTPVFAGGRISLPVQKVLEAVGLRKSLQMAPFRLRQGTADMWALPLHRRLPLGEAMSIDRQLGPQRREKVTDEFCDWIDRCLGVPEIDQQLTDDGKAWIASLISELLDNAERHSSRRGGDGMWSVAGFMSKRRAASPTQFTLAMAILSLGQSISDSLETASDSVKARIDAYVDAHRRCGISRETLRTVVALQDYITRVKEASDDSRGGIGFQEVLDFASELGTHPQANKQPRMSVISGRACIQIGTPYVKGVRRDMEGEPRELWFNPSNSPSYPPERSHVYDLKYGFPGTMISLRLNLDPQVLQASVKE